MDLDCSSREILPLVHTRSLLIIFVTQIFSCAHTIFFSHPKFLIQQIFLSGRHTAVSGESFNCESSQPVIVLSNSFSIMCNFSVQLFHILPVNQLIRNCFDLISANLWNFTKLPLTPSYSDFLDFQNFISKSGRETLFCM